MLFYKAKWNTYDDKITITDGFDFKETRMGPIETPWFEFSLNGSRWYSGMQQVMYVLRKEIENPYIDFHMEWVPVAHYHGDDIAR